MATQGHTSPVGSLARLFWLLAGPMFLLLLAVAVVRTGNGWLTPVDFAFLGVLAAMLLARWLEFRAGNPLTADGEPATPVHLRRYLVGATATGLAVWCAANVVGNYLLVR
jgi:hypothetical protein